MAKEKTAAQPGLSGRENGTGNPSSKSRLAFLKLDWQRLKRLGKIPLVGWLVQLEDKVATLLSLLLKFIVFLVVAGLFSLIYKEMKQQRFAMEVFHVPKAFEEGGFDGYVVANRILDKVREIKTSVSSEKTDSLQFKSETGPEMNVSLMGFGVSLQSVIYYSRELFGRENRSIGGELTEMDSTLQLKLRVTGLPPIHFEQTLRSQNRLAALNQLLQKAAEHVLLKTDPYRLGIYLTHEDRYREALNTIRHLLNNTDQDHEWAYLAWGNLLRAQGKFEDAITKFEKSIELNPNFSLPEYNIGWSYRNLNIPEKAIEHFRKATVLRPESGKYWNALAWSLLINKEYEAANIASAKATEVEPGAAWLWSNRGDIKRQVMQYIDDNNIRALNATDTSELVQFFRKAHDADPESSNGCFSLAGALFFAGNLEGALKMIRMAIDLDPENESALTSYRGYMYNNAKDFAEALRANRLLLRSARKRNNTYQEQSALNHMAMCKYSLLQFDSAFQFVRQAIAIDTNQSYPYTTLAEIYGLTEEDELFYQSLEKALAKGHNLRSLLDYEPYSSYVTQNRFKALLDRYPD